MGISGPKCLPIGIYGFQCVPCVTLWGLLWVSAGSLCVSMGLNVPHCNPWGPYVSHCSAVGPSVYLWVTVCLYVSQESFPLL